MDDKGGMPVARVLGMDRRRAALLTFLLTAASMEAFLFGFGFIADQFPQWVWAAMLPIVIPVWPITLPLELATGWPLQVMHHIQNVLVSIFWGFVAAFVAYSWPRKVTV